MGGGCFIFLTLFKGNKTTYAYDKNDNLTKVTNALDEVTKYSYDKLGNRTKQTRVSKDGTKNQVTGYKYDSNSLLTTTTDPVGAMTYPDGKVVQYAYDVAGNLVKVTGTKKGTRIYTYDDFNNRKGKEESGKDKITYTYNNLNEFVKETQGTDTKSYSYDARGNLSTKKVNGITKETYTFDSTNMLTSVKNTSNKTTSKYEYDGAGNRIKKTVSKNNKVVSKKSYVIDTMSSYQDIIAEADTLTGNETDFTYGLGLVSVESVNGISYYRIDEKNSVEEIQNSTSVAKAEIDYDEFGNVEKPDDIGTNGNIFSYTGHVYDAESSQLYVKARYYDSETGRFISEDSDLGDIEELVTKNLYVYCKENPLMYYDLDGHSSSVPTLVNDGGSSKGTHGGSGKKKRTGKTYVTKQQLQKIYTNTTVTDEMVNDLNRVLVKYGITNVENIQHFIAQTCIETGYGRSVVERGSDKYLNNQPYGKKYSGVGYIQMTWDYDYAAFATYMILEQHPDLKSVATYKNPKHNSKEIIFNAYNKIVAAAKNKGYSIKQFTNIVDVGRDNVKNNYAWETAGYFWSTNGLTSANKNTPVDDVTKVVNKWTASYEERRTAYNKVIKVIK